MEAPVNPEVLEAPPRSVADEQEAANKPFLPLSVVQGEWDQTIARLRDLCEVIDYSPLASDRVAHIIVKRDKNTNVEGIERILFQNLTFAPWTKTAHDDKIIFGGEWIHRWRKNVPFKAEHIGPMSSLAPWVPRDQWTYRYNLIEVEN